MAENKKVKERTNRVEVVGKLANLEFKQTQSGGMKFWGAVQIGDDPNFKVSFHTIFPVRPKTQAGDDNKAYKGLNDIAVNAQTIKSAGQAGASKIRLGGKIGMNDWYDSNKDVLNEVQTIVPYSAEIVTGDDKPEAKISFEGIIQSIKPETNRDGETTGRLRVNVVSVSKRDGRATPFSFIVPEKTSHFTAEQFTDIYEVGQTATFSILYKCTQTAAPKSTGGIGVQWTTGKSFVEKIMVGATAPIDEDEPGAISKDDLKKAMTERKAYLASKKQQGEDYAKTKETPAPSMPSEDAWTAIGEEDPDDLPF